MSENDIKKKFERNIAVFTKMTLNQEQRRAFEKVKQGDNLFLTGEAGTGKSTCLRTIIEWARAERLNIGVTATTGSAAILIRGSTLHSFLGIGLATKTAAELVDQIKNKKKFVYNRIRSLEILLIDEISMMDAELFDKISAVISLIKNKNAPFGGIQVILCGDLFQLPPVKGRLLFHSQAFKDLDIEIVQLMTPHRHLEDDELLKMLRELRVGECSDETLAKLKATYTNTFPEGILPTMLYSRNVDVDKINTTEFTKLIKEGKRSFSYDMKSSCAVGHAWAESCKIPEICEVCEGAQVVLTSNVDLDMGLCNGARGVVVSVGLSGVTVQFAKVRALISYCKLENEDNKKIWISYMPLRLAYALTINKCQGMTLDCVVVVLESAKPSSDRNLDFYYGRAYTALTRVRSLKDIRIINVSKGAFVAHPEVIQFYNEQGLIL